MRCNAIQLVQVSGATGLQLPPRQNNSYGFATSGLPGLVACWPRTFGAVCLLGYPASLSAHIVLCTAIHLGPGFFLLKGLAKVGFVEGLARPLVRQSAGPLVPGPLVLWSAGPLVFGPLVLVPLARLFSGSPVRTGALVLWSRGPPVLGSWGPWVLVILARLFSLVLWLTRCLVV